MVEHLQDLAMAIGEAIRADCWVDTSFPVQASGGLVFAHGAVASVDDFAKVIGRAYVETSPADGAWGTTCKVSAFVVPTDVKMSQRADGTYEVAAMLTWVSS